MTERKLDVNQEFPIETPRDWAALITYAARNMVRLGKIDIIGRLVFPAEFTIVVEQAKQQATEERVEIPLTGVYGRLVEKFHWFEELTEADPEVRAVPVNTKEVLAIEEAFKERCLLYDIDIAELFPTERANIKDYFTAYKELLERLRAAGGPELIGIQEEVEEILMRNRIWGGEARPGDKLRYI